MTSALACRLAYMLARTGHRCQGGSQRKRRYRYQGRRGGGWCARWGSGRKGPKDAPVRSAPLSAQAFPCPPLPTRGIGWRGEGRCPAWHIACGEAAT
eukprot:1915040-Pleurochrysis_carterae.AAC.1